LQVRHSCFFLTSGSCPAPQSARASRLVARGQFPVIEQIGPKRTPGFERRLH